MPTFDVFTFSLRSFVDALLKRIRESKSGTECIGAAREAVGGIWVADQLDHIDTTEFMAMMTEVHEAGTKRILAGFDKR